MSLIIQDSWFAENTFVLHCPATSILVTMAFAAELSAIVENWPKNGPPAIAEPILVANQKFRKSFNRYGAIKVVSQTLRAE